MPGERDQCLADVVRAGQRAIEEDAPDVVAEGEVDAFGIEAGHRPAAARASGEGPGIDVYRRAMVGGARDPGAVTLPDDVLLRTVQADLTRTMGSFGKPELVRIFRHERGIPQYTLGHLDRVAGLEAALRFHAGLFLAGNSYSGVAINSCIAAAGPLTEWPVPPLWDGHAGPRIADVVTRWLASR